MEKTVSAVNAVKQFLEFSEAGDVANLNNIPATWDNPNFSAGEIVITTILLPLFLANHREFLLPMLFLCQRTSHLMESVRGDSR